MRDAVALFAFIQAAIAAIGTAVMIAGSKHAGKTADALGVVTAIHRKVVLIIVTPNKHDEHGVVQSAWGIIVPKS